MDDLPALRPVELPTSQTEVVALLEWALERAKAGEFRGVLLLYETDRQYHHQKAGLRLATCLMLLTRTIHHINREWDGAP